ncbi:GtrA domain-containing protein [Azospirillaceae bacterium]
MDMCFPPYLLRFLLSGSATAGVDAGVYWLFLTLGVVVDVAKVFGLVVGTIFAYAVNRFWTFGDTRRAVVRLQIPRFLLVYLLAILLNVAVNRLAITLIEYAGRQEIALPLAWFIATGCSATFNYFGLRFFVFCSGASRSALSVTPALSEELKTEQDIP